MAIVSLSQFIGGNAILPSSPRLDVFMDITRLLDVENDIYRTAVCESLCHPSPSFTCVQVTTQRPRKQEYYTSVRTLEGAVLVSKGVTGLNIGVNLG